MAEGHRSRDGGSRDRKLRPAAEPSRETGRREQADNEPGQGDAAGREERAPGAGRHPVERKGQQHQGRGRRRSAEGGAEARREGQEREGGESLRPRQAAEAVENHHGQHRRDEGDEGERFEGRGHAPPQQNRRQGRESERRGDAAGGDETLVAGALG
jgi:hypothetical protein